MNKKIIALAITAAAATSGANAANVYDNGTTAMNLKGEIDVYLSDTNNTDFDADLWAKIQIDATHQLNEETTLFGSFEMENGNFFLKEYNDENGVSTDDLYAGLSYGEHFGIAFGEVGDFGDSFDAITIDNTNEGYAYMDDFVTSFESKGHTIAVKGEFDGLTVIADTYLTDDEDLDAAYGISVQYDIAGLTLGASFQDHGNRAAYSEKGENGDSSVWGVRAGYEIADFSIDANFVAEENDGDDIDSYGLTAAYQLDALRFYTSVGTADKDGESEDLEFVTIGADYAVANNILVFVEYADVQAYESANDIEQAVLGTYFTF